MLLRVGCGVVVAWDGAPPRRDRRLGAAEVGPGLRVGEMRRPRGQTPGRPRGAGPLPAPRSCAPSLHGASSGASRGDRLRGSGCRQPGPWRTESAAAGLGRARWKCAETENCNTGTRCVGRSLPRAGLRASAWRSAGVAQAGKLTRPPTRPDRALALPSPPSARPRPAPASPRAGPELELLQRLHPWTWGLDALRLEREARSKAGSLRRFLRSSERVARSFIPAKSVHGAPALLPGSAGCWGNRGSSGPVTQPQPWPGRVCPSPQPLSCCTDNKLRVRG